MWNHKAGEAWLCRRKKSYTDRLERYVLDLLECMTIQDVSYNLRMRLPIATKLEYVKRNTEELLRKAL
jgi:hypothetical protein